MMTMTIPHRLRPLGSRGRWRRGKSGRCKQSMEEPGDDDSDDYDDETGVDDDADDDDGTDQSKGDEPDKG